MNKKYKDIIIEKNHQNLELIKKEVPNYDWKQQRLECKTMVWDNDFRRRTNPTRSIGESVKFYYQTIDRKNSMVGWIEIECLWDNKKSELNTHKICMNYEDRGTYGCRNWKEVKTSKRMKMDGVTPMETWEGGVYKDVDTTHEEQWNQVRDYFQTYLIPFEERMKNKVPTPRLDKIRYYLNYCSTYEYDLIMMEMLYGEDISFTMDDGTEYPNNDKKCFLDIFENFENQFKEDYPKEKSGWFGSPIQMLKTYMVEKGVHEMEYWLEDKQEEIQKEMEEV